MAQAIRILAQASLLGSTLPAVVCQLIGAGLVTLVPRHLIRAAFPRGIDEIPTSCLQESPTNRRVIGLSSALARCETCEIVKMQPKGPKWWRGWGHCMDANALFGIHRREPASLLERLRLCTRTTAISTGKWAAALVECACVRHRAGPGQAVKMPLNNTIHSLYASRRVTRKGTLIDGRQQHFAPFCGHSVTANL